MSVFDMLYCNHVFTVNNCIPLYSIPLPPGMNLIAEDIFQNVYTLVSVIAKKLRHTGKTHHDQVTGVAMGHSMIR